jgi:hypothetical protein
VALERKKARARIQEELRRLYALKKSGRQSDKNVVHNLNAGHTKNIFETRRGPEIVPNQTN